MAAEPAFEVQADAVARHAATVDDVAEQTARSRSAASSVTVGPDAYGFLGRLIPALLDTAQDATVNALQESVDALQRSADDLRTTARRYAEADERAADGFRRGSGP